MMRDIEKGIGLALSIIGSIGTSFAIGYMLDKWLTTTPLFMIVGLLGGTVLAFWYLYHFGTRNVEK